MAAQFTATMGLSERPDWWWMDRATISLPVPFSPVMSTQDSVGATRPMTVFRSAMAGDSPVRLTGCSEEMRVRRAWFSWRRRENSMALRAATTTFSRESGFSMKSKAPFLSAWTAVSMVPCPEIMITGSPL